jgi:ATP-dependent DNA helicase RecG
MPIEKHTISPAQKASILAYEENHFVDLKALDIAPGKLTRSIAAFANADGGDLYVGIDEDRTARVRTWRGFDSVEAANGHIQPFDQLFPLGSGFEYSFLACEGGVGLVLQVSVLKSSDIKKASDGNVYVRRGAQNLPVTTREAHQRLEYAKGLTSFESTLLDVEPQAIEDAAPTAEFMLHVVPAGKARPWLTKHRLLREGKPSVAGVLLFAESPQAILPKRCGIKIYRYGTKDAVGTRETLAFTPLTVEGHLYAQVREAVAQTTRVIEEVRRLGDASLESITYPNEALHEIITNAVLHRDYSIADDIHIRVFDNRVEVESPGRLPAHITVDNILDERFSRNGTLVWIINKFPDPPNQDVGEGLNTAFAAMRKLGLKPPLITERDNSVLVVVRHEALASTEQRILEFLESHDTIRNREAREICNVSGDYVIKRVFGQLVDRGLIEQVPGTDRATTTYRAGPNFAQWRAETAPE